MRFGVFACARRKMLSPNPALRPSWRVAAGHMVMWQEDAAAFKGMLALLRPFCKEPLWTYGNRPVGAVRDPTKTPTAKETLGALLSPLLTAASLLVSAVGGVGGPRGLGG